MGQVPIPGLKGIPIFGSLFTLSHGLAHRTLACMASSHSARQLMAFSLGSTPVVVASDPNIAREILTSPHFASRPIKESARQLMFTKAIGFAPDGSYWRMLRRIASTQLFSPRCILTHECDAMVHAIAIEQSLKGKIQLRKHLQDASLNNIMQIVFGKRYEAHDEEAKMLHELVIEGFELLGAFNWSDHLPWLKYFYDPFRIQERCRELVPRVEKLVKKIIDEHKRGDVCDFVDVLLSLEGEEKLDQEDMVAVLWEMIFRGTDTTSLLTEWIMAELILNPQVQLKLYQELQTVARANNNLLTYAHISKLPYLDAVIKETLRLHPPGPLLSWARLSTSDVSLTNGMVIPAHTTAMVNMWAITHNSNIWADPLAFKPERFMACDGGDNIDVRGNDLRIAPFGAGRRVCPGKNLGLTIVRLWVAKLVHSFKWDEDENEPVDLSEELKLSCEMKKPLSSIVALRIGDGDFDVQGYLRA